MTSIERTAYPQFKAAAAIREAALVKNHPPDLINVALERLVEASLELPAFSTLDELAATIRAVPGAVVTSTQLRAPPPGQATWTRILPSRTRRPAPG